jgi:hypothetical protein
LSQPGFSHQLSLLSPLGENVHTFNANFYVVTATVIPIFYLALTLQGTTFEKMMTYWGFSSKTPPLTFRSLVRRNIITYSSIGFVIFIFVFGVYGEYLALHALYSQDSSPGTEQVVLFNATVLLVITAAGPFIRFVTSIVANTRAEIIAEAEAKAARNRREKEHPSDEEPGSSQVGE